METIHNLFELSLAELANHHPEDFYDPATRKLRSEYSWYPSVETNLLEEAKEIVRADKNLLAHIRAVQHPGRAAAVATPVPTPAPAASADPAAP